MKKCIGKIMFVVLAILAVTIPYGALMSQGFMSIQWSLLNLQNVNNRYLLTSGTSGVTANLGGQYGESSNVCGQYGGMESVGDRACTGQGDRACAGQGSNVCGQYGGMESVSDRACAGQSDRACSGQSSNVCGQYGGMESVSDRACTGQVLDQPCVGDRVDKPVTQAKASCLVAYGTGEVLKESHMTERYPIASMCKMMSLLLIFERIESGAMTLGESVIISENASGMGGSQVFLSANEKYRVGDLVKSIVVASANDATVAMAETLSGNEETFVSEMNKRAAKLGMVNTQFSNSTGLPKPGQYSTAQDVAIMARALFAHEGYYQYSRIWMDELVHEGGRVTGLTNTNKLVRFYPGCDGGKTGYTSEAGHCISATATRDGLRLISVIIGAVDSQSRFEQAKSLFGYGFANFKSVHLVKKGEVVPSVCKVSGGKLPAISVAPERDYFAFTPRNGESAYRLEVDLPGEITAPIAKGQVIGKILILKDSAIVEEINLIALDSVDAKTYGDSLKDIAKKWGLG